MLRLGVVLTVLAQQVQSSSSVSSWGWWWSHLNTQHAQDLLLIKLCKKIDLLERGKYLHACSCKFFNRPDYFQTIMIKSIYRT